MEYKFCAQTVPTKKWVYGLPCYKHDFEIAVLEVIDFYISNGQAKCYKKKCNIDPKTLRQYINRKDINGMEIYVSDIVKVKLSAGYSECYEWKTFIVVFDEKQLSFTLQPIGEVSPWFGVNALKYANEVEVVGNIFDNPELTEKV